MNKAILTPIRAFFSVTSAVAPTLAGRLGFRLFCTTFKATKKSAQQNSILSEAEVVFANAIHHNVAYSGGTIAAYEFQPDDKLVNSEISSQRVTKSENNRQTVLLVHGWQSQSLFMNKFIEPLLVKGFRVVAIDLPGHGQSSGRLFHLPLAVDAMHAVQQHLGTFNRIISHSLGGPVVATTLAGTLQNYPAIEVEAAVLISSPDSMVKIFNDFSATIGLNRKANAALHENVTRLSGRVTEDFNVAAQLKNVTGNILVMHAPDDKEVPFSEAESITRETLSASLKPMNGLGHRRIIADDEVVTRAVSFVSSV